MGHWREPKIVVPHYDIPVGTLFTIQNREGLLVAEKQEDGGWQAVSFDGKLGTLVREFT